MSKLRLSDQAGLLTIANGVDRFIQFVTGIVLVRLLTVSEYGTYRQVWIIYGMLAPLFTMGISSSFYRFMPILSEKEQKVFVSNSIFVLSCLGALFTAILYFFAEYLGVKFHNPEAGRLLKIFSFFPLFSFPTYYMGGFLIVKEKIFASITLTSASALSKFLIVIVPLTLHLNLDFVFYGIVYLSFCMMMIKLFYTAKVLQGFCLRLNLPLLMKQLRFTIPLGFAESLGAITKLVDKFMVSIYFLVEKFAIFARGSFELPFMHILTGAVTSVTIPRISELYDKNKIKDLLRLWHESVRKISLIIYPICVFCFIFADNIIVLLYSNKYLGSAAPFRIYLFLTLLRTNSYGSILLVLGFSRVLFWGTLFSLIGNIIFNIIFIKIFGVLGAAIASVFVVYCLAFTYLYKTKKILNVSFREIFPWKEIGKIFIISLISGLCLIPFLLLSAANLLVIIPAGIVFLLIYIYLLRKLKILHSGDKDLIKRWINFNKLWKNLLEK